MFFAAFLNGDRSAMDKAGAAESRCRGSRDFPAITGGLRGTAARGLSLSLVRDRVRGYKKIRARTLFRHNLRLPHEVIAIINRMLRPGQQPKFAAAPAQTGLLSKPKKSLSELSANRGCALTSRASARNPFGEPNISDFEILSALPVNAESVFAGEMRPYCRRWLFSGANHPRADLPASGCPFPPGAAVSQSLRRPAHLWFTAPQWRPRLAGGRRVLRLSS
jgi:hypothetical protein